MATPATDLERLLNAGIAAYQQGEYEQAKTFLLKLSRCASRTYRTKAGMGLVRVYMAQQDWGPAKTLCQKISESPKPAVQQWAKSTLNKIHAKAGTSLDAQPAHATSPKNTIHNASGSWVDNPPPGISIFHYAYLNGDADLNGKADSNGEVEATALPVNPPASQGYELPHAGRLSQGRTLGKKKKRTQLWFAQSVGAAAFFVLLLYLVCGTIAPLNDALKLLLKILPASMAAKLSFLPVEPSYWAGRLLGALLVVAIASPWLWDVWLRLTANRQPFSNQKLREISPEAATLLNKRCQQKRWPLPTLWKLPTQVPLMFSYGWLPRNARLVVSEGLLTQLATDEIATLIGYEMSHWKTFYWPLLSLQGIVLQLFHQLYWQLALWGNRLPQSGRIKPLIALVGIAANASYVGFWLLQMPGLWLSRVRTYYGDRAATEATGNPNAIARALIKLSFGLAHSIAKQGYTPPMLESLTLLLPVSADLTRQSLYGSLPLAQLFAWDSLNPLRNWMSISDTHPPLGDRLRVIMAYSQHWKLAPELPLAALPQRRKALSQPEWARLMSQGMPFFGLAFGFAVGLFLQLLGAIGDWLSWPIWDWMYQDKSLLYAFMLLGLSLGTMLRINRFFPDLPLKMPPSQDLPGWISDPALLPVSSLPAKLSGTLLGRPGLANWLGQELILKTDEAHLLKLHFFSAIGPLGNVLSRQTKTTALVGKSVQLLGWFRRGNLPWLDIDKLRLNNRHNGTWLQAAHPIFSLGVAITTGATALWLMGFGQIFHETVNKLR
jgi:Zn-dependent protease with chaperone function